MDFEIIRSSLELMTYISDGDKTGSPTAIRPFRSKYMNDNTHFSYQQVLDSIEEMRTSLRPDTASLSGGDWDSSIPFWEEGVSQSATWFEDCDFDPRGLQED